MTPPIPVTVVSGFLGSGKTTLLCGLLERRQERRLAVLINEIGEVSIDGALVRTSSQGGVAGGIEIVDFPSGLIAYAEDTRFVPTLLAIARRTGRVDQVLIETSGVALPSAAMARLQSPELAEYFVLDATLVVVDTPRLLAGEFDRTAVRGTAGAAAGTLDAQALSAGAPGAGAFGAGALGAEALAAGTRGAGAVAAGAVGASALAAGALFDQQLAAADVVILNKVDDLDTKSLLEAEEQVRRRAPNVRFLELAHRARLDARLALGLRLHQAPSAGMRHYHGFAPMPASDTQPLNDHRRIDGHSHSGLMAHAHGLTTHTHFHEQDPGWLSFTLRSDAQQDTDQLRGALERIAAAEPLLRCKGFVQSSTADRPILIQGVRTRVVATESGPAAQLKDSELVFIGYHLGRARVAAMLRDMTGTAWR
jgi:cobalamin biosynthesis protein CobW